MTQLQEETEGQESAPWVITADVFLLMLLCALANAAALVKKDRSPVPFHPSQASSIEASEELLAKLETENIALLAAIRIAKADLNSREFTGAAPNVTNAESRKASDSRASPNAVQVQLAKALSASESRVADLEREVLILQTAKRELGESLLEQRQLASASENVAKSLSLSVLEHEKKNSETIFDLASYKKQVAQLEAQVTALRQNIQPEKHESNTAHINTGMDDKRIEGELRKELIGIDGKIDRSIFVIDRSESMNEDGRWQFVQGTIAKWVELLPVQEVGLVIFSNNSESIPSDAGSRIAMNTIEGRLIVTNAVAALTPRGATNTLSAIKRAYSFPQSDAIFLFTDGRPTESENRSNANANAMQEVVKYVKQMQMQGRTERIHVVALGDYFDKDFADFLKSLTNATGGTFIGR